MRNIRSKLIIQRLFPLQTKEEEKTFLTYQRDLREGGTHVLNEAMMVLDIIDAKTSSLLNYISISLAAMVFLITSLPTSKNLRLPFFDERILTLSLLLVILALLAAIILCLSCLNIVGGHTIRSLECLPDQPEGQQKYEEFIVKVSCRRRIRYLVAQRISICTAFFILLVFAFLLLGSVVATVPSPIPLDPNSPL